MSFSLDDKIIARRTLILGAAMLAPFPILLGRMFYLQNIIGVKYRKLAEKNRIQAQPLKPIRGVILDRNDVRIAYDTKAYQLVLIKEQTPNVEKTLNNLNKIVELGSHTRNRILKDIKRHAAFTPITIFKTLAFDDLIKVQANMPYLQGIDLLEVTRRRYPLEDILGHVAGYVGFIKKEKKYNPADATDWPDDFAIGLQGVEKSFDDQLKGKIGILQSEINAHGRPIREIYKAPAEAGAPLSLAIDLELQETAWEAIGGHVGAAVAIDIQTGEILVSASKPSFKPSSFADGLDSKTWDSLRNNYNRPLLHRALKGAYAPGSTFKTVVAIAAMEEGLVRPSEIINCVGKIKLGNREFNCWKKHGRVDLIDSIAQSCDIYYYELGKRLGVDKIAKYAHMFGLGEVTGSELPESEGLVPTKAWKLKAKGERWAGGEDLITAIGQGFMLATPLQLAVMSARIASGKKVIPTFKKQDFPVKFEDLPISKEAMEVARRGMFGVVNDPHGTAKRAANKGFITAGKTGTAQVISQRIDEDTDMEDVEYKKRPHGLFVAYAPYNSPRFAVSTIVEHGGSGSGAAAPVAAKLLKHIMEKEMAKKENLPNEMGEV